MFLPADGIFPEPRRLDSADIHGVTAPWMEGAAGRRIDRIRHVALEDDPVRAMVQVGDRNGRQQGLRIGMGGVGIEVVGVGQLHDPPEVHHRDPVAYVFHDAQVVRDEDIGEAALLLQRHEKVEHLGPYGHVQGAHRLVADDQFGVHAERPGYADALPLPAGELVGIAVHVFGSHVYGLEQIADYFPPLRPRPRPVLSEGILEGADDGEGGVKGRVGILEHDLHALSGGHHIGGRQCPEILVHAVEIVEDLSLARPDEPKDGLAERRLAAARLADESESLAPVDVEIDAVHSLHLSHHLLQQAFFHRKICFDALERQEDSPIFHRAPPSRSAST